MNIAAPRPIKPRSRRRLLELETLEDRYVLSVVTVVPRAAIEATAVAAAEEEPEIDEDESFDLAAEKIVQAIVHTHLHQWVSLHLLHDMLESEELREHEIFDRHTANPDRIVDELVNLLLNKFGIDVQAPSAELIAAVFRSDDVVLHDALVTPLVNRAVLPSEPHAATVSLDPDHNGAYQRESVQPGEKRSADDVSLSHKTLAASTLELQLPASASTVNDNDTDDESRPYEAAGTGEERNADLLMSSLPREIGAVERALRSLLDTLRAVVEDGWTLSLWWGASLWLAGMTLATEMARRNRYFTRYRSRDGADEEQILLREQLP